MHIAFDAKRLFSNRSGLGNYSRTLVGNLVERNPEHQYGLYTTKVDEQIDNAQLLASDSVYMHHKSGFGKAIWRSSGIGADLAAKGVNLYHGLSQEVPRGLSGRGIKRVVTIHDLVQQLFPEQFKFVDRTIYNLKVGHALARADAIVAITDHTRQDILTRYPEVDPAKVKRIYQSCDPRFWKPDAKLSLAVKTKFELPSAYNLFVGSFIRRKNIQLILEAYQKLSAADRIPLVLVGRGPAHRKELEVLAKAYNIDHLLLWRTDVNETEELRQIYAGASLFIYPSFYEGFGIPLIESTLCGTAVISATMPALMEAGGPDARYVEATKPESLAAAITELLGDEGLRSEMVTHSKQYVHTEFAAHVVTDQLLTLYQTLLIN